MPTYEVSFYLRSGGTAKITFENVSGLSTMKQNVDERLAAAGDKFQMSHPTNLIVLKKDEIIGHSIEQL